jgi:hypothetical protein
MYPQYFLAAAREVRAINPSRDHYNQANAGLDPATIINNAFLFVFRYYSLFFDSCRLVARTVDRENPDVFAFRNHNFLLREAILSPDTPLCQKMQGRVVEAASGEVATVAS